MSRNKQIDRLREGLTQYISESDLSIDKIKDPVDFALQVIKVRQAAILSLRAEQEKSDKEVKELFRHLHKTLLTYGYDESAMIARGMNNSTSTLKEMGFSNTLKAETREDKVLLLVLLWYIMGDLKAKVSRTSVENGRDLRKAVRKNETNIDFLHSEMLSLGLWDDILPVGENTFKDMVNHFVSQYRIMQKDFNSLDILSLDQQNRWIRQGEDIQQQNLVIKELTKELKAQTATTRQVKRELALLREDDIRLAISGSD